MTARANHGSRHWLAHWDVLVTAGLALLSLLLGAVTESNVVAGLLSTLLVLVLPGYALFAAINAASAAAPTAGVPQPSPHAERVLLSLALSIALVVLGGLVLNVLPAGMTRNAWRLWLALVTVGLAVYAIVKRTRGMSGRASAVPRLPAPDSVSMLSLRDFGMFAAAAIVLGLALGLGGVGATERPRAPFTQFWAVPRADGSTVEVGIRNDEDRAISYHIYALSGDIILSDEGNIRLPPGETWQAQLPVAIQGGGEGINLLLYRDDAPLTVYRSLRVAAPVSGQIP